MYGDILSDNKSKLRDVADIGGGLSCLSKKLATNNNYTLVDPLVHDSKCDVVNMKVFINSLNIRLVCTRYFYRL